MVGQGSDDRDYDAGTALDEIPAFKTGQRLTAADLNALGHAVAENRRVLMALAAEVLGPEALHDLLKS